MASVVFDEAKKLVIAKDDGISDDFKNTLTEINTLYRAFLSQNNDNPPPPPAPNTVLPQRSQQIAKFRDTAHAQLRQKRFGEAYRSLGFGIEMAASRPLWEPAQLCRDELINLYLNSSGCAFANKDYPSAMVDAEIVIELNRGFSKGYLALARAKAMTKRFDEAIKLLGDAKSLESPVSPDYLAIEEEVMARAREHNSIKARLIDSSA